jgi:hypothetical protein
MRKDESKPDVEDYLQPVGGVGGQMVPPADNALFVPDDEAEDDDTGVNEEDVSTQDEGLLDPGASPEFDHSLRRRKPSGDSH